MVFHLTAYNCRMLILDLSDTKDLSRLPGSSCNIMQKPNQIHRPLWISIYKVYATHPFFDPRLRSDQHRLVVVQSFEWQAVHRIHTELLFLLTIIEMNTQLAVVDGVALALIPDLHLNITTTIVIASARYKITNMSCLGYIAQSVSCLRNDSPDTTQNQKYYDFASIEAENTNIQNSYNIVKRFSCYFMRFEWLWQSVHVVWKLKSEISVLTMRTAPMLYSLLQIWTESRLNKHIYI